MTSFNETSSVVATVVSEESEARNDCSNSLHVGIIKQMEDIQQNINQMAMDSLWDKNGVALLETVLEKGNDGIDSLVLATCTSWEMLDGDVEDKPCAIVNCGGTSLDEVLGKVSGGNQSKDNPTNETLSTTGSLSVFSVFSNAKSTTFISSQDDEFNTFDLKQLLNNNGKSGKKGKRHLRTIAKLIDPKLEKKIKDRKGLWSGCYEDPDTVYENSVEVEFGSEPLNPKCWKSAVDMKTGEIYYYHSKTKEVTWTKPEGFRERTKSTKIKKSARSGNEYVLKPGIESGKKSQGRFSRIMETGIEV
mmetsp:Transcript_21708/g.45661  ORF Transcript_21708/g.45661 Transcript_21708/m.45661 type:complete len:304 (-) Transcript_21708:158-1069(-)